MLLPIVDEPARAAKPAWLRAPAPAGPALDAVAAVVEEVGLPTICTSARCPNQGVCWRDGTATLLLLGDTCTRACRFCHTGVRRGREHRPAALAVDEPERVVRAVRLLGLRHAVLTCVDRDDLDDGGAAQLAACVRAVHEHAPAVVVELLAPDFSTARAPTEALATVLAAEPDVFAHNLETVERTTPQVRDRRASYLGSLALLAAAKQRSRDVVTKSGLMLGLGERDDEIDQALRDLRAADVDIVTLGQYLRPSSRALPVERYLAPAELERWAERARGLGFVVAAGPLVRSSFRAGALYDELAARAVTGTR